MYFSLCVSYKNDRPRIFNMHNDTVKTYTQLKRCDK